jgi:hypothetical protein
MNSASVRDNSGSCGCGGRTHRGWVRLGDLQGAELPVHAARACTKRERNEESSSLHAYSCSPQLTAQVFLDPWNLPRGALLRDTTGPT